MACLQPGQGVEATGFVLPVSLGEVAIALEDIVPRLINAAGCVDGCRAVVSIVDRIESCGAEPMQFESMPEAASPIMPLEGDQSTAALIDSWLAKGTILGEDGSYTVFVAFMDVMRRPLQGSWTASSITLLGTKQSALALIEELELEFACA
ncbi:MAG: hypothetical protein Q7W16_06650 [Coriobacteriia bacterium]|nr:hypothetical protein [Coriobacteriia bacterium]